jgi:hypothetical protein
MNLVEARKHKVVMNPVGPLKGLMDAREELIFAAKPLLRSRKVGERRSNALSIRQANGTRETHNELTMSERQV